ncbi:unnamed protein product [Rotaria sp. Silwood2]|nr:unnamed protein product [Rotaria sp. Silwood2]
MICYICLQHNDHNVVSSSLERLEIILKLSNLFDFDQLLISTQIGSVEKTCVSQTLQTVYSTYQRSFIEINEEYNILLNKMNDEFDSTQMINNEKRTSAAKLVNQLYFFPIRYILKMNGTIKSDDESRINVKCAIPTCLIFIKNLVNLIILLKVLHLLSLREHGDLHLHDACFVLNVRRQAIVSSSSAVTKSSNVSSQVSLNNSLTYVHTISIRQPIIYFTWISVKKYINTNESDFQTAILNLLVQLFYEIFYEF